MAERPACAVCQLQTEPDPDDQWTPDGAFICGECYRAREFDELLWEAEEA